ncbi:C-C motif chemokine 19-like isoform X3 [Scleropages formosus]|uniref:C-C motif chemokine 19-like isoform X3 n=1 Tax=Scleropages formosus TaxID=113540 RepID=UPI0010FA83E0|nr:C-C motif chemokine 19-like isoform X3 [Scleropages formosus]XP_029115149.1 C-C motif chemokine 19-like isoform X3 [Scleropages formosus]
MRCEDLQRRQESRAEQSRAKQSRAEEQRNSMALKIASLLLLALVLCSYASAFTEEAVDCCLTTSNKQIPRKVVKAYREQTTNGGCAIAATQFITVKDKTLCAPPPGRNDWVAKLIRRLKTKGQE